MCLEPCTKWKQVEKVLEMASLLTDPDWNNGRVTQETIEAHLWRDLFTNHEII